MPRASDLRYANMACKIIMQHSFNVLFIVLKIEGLVFSLEFFAML